ncbi:hypothetical protein D3C71_1707360 [compost metagenome]
MAVVHRIAGLAEGAKEVAGNKDDPEHQHAFVQPAGHAAPQVGSRADGMRREAGGIKLRRASGGRSGHSGKTAQSGVRLENY